MVVEKDPIRIDQVFLNRFGVGGVANKSCTTEWWNAVAWYLSTSFLSLSSFTVNRCSAAGVTAIPYIVSGNSDTILFR